jgi:hypothetical protein
MDWFVKHDCCFRRIADPAVLAFERVDLGQPSVGHPPASRDAHLTDQYHPQNNCALKKKGIS